jgi:hypothetical protein
VRARGAILAESAVAAASILTLMFGMIDFGLVGFLQITVDAGSFLDAHETVLIATNQTNGTADPNAYTTGIFQQINPSSIQAPVQTQPNPVPTVYVDYGYNTAASPDPTQRHGGAAMMMPYNERVNIQQTAFSFMQQQFNARSSSTEPLWTEVGSHWDVNNIGYTQSPASAPAGFNSNYFTQGDNTPLYYTGFNFMQTCPGQNMPWTTCSASSTATATYVGLGVAEYLTNFNNSFTQTGISGAAPSGSGVWPGSVGSATGIFEAVACHQRSYASLAADFAAFEAAAGSAANTGPYIQSTFTVAKNNGGNLYNYFAITPPGSVAPDFCSAAGTSTASCGATSLSGGLKTAARDATNQVQEIYDWDYYPSEGNNFANGGSFITTVTSPYLGCV